MMHSLIISGGHRHAPYRIDPFHPWGQLWLQSNTLRSSSNFKLWVKEQLDLMKNNPSPAPRIMMRWRRSRGVRLFWQRRHSLPVRRRRRAPQQKPRPFTCSYLCLPLRAENTPRVSKSTLLIHVTFLKCELNWYGPISVKLLLAHRHSAASPVSLRLAPHRKLLYICLLTSRALNYTVQRGCIWLEQRGAADSSCVVVSRRS